MNHKVFFWISLFLFSLGAFGQDLFYNSQEIQEIRIQFSQNNWDQILDSLYIAGDKERIEATLFINGIQYDSVGVRYKGYSSCSIDQIKNPFNIKLNYLIEGQKHEGFDKIKLSNVIQDPSFLREVLSYEIVRKYMPASESNFANVYVNDTLIGLYSNVEAVNNEFLEKHFKGSDNVFVKGNPKTVDLYGENSNLSQSPGMDSLDYTSLYSMESIFGWRVLYDFIDTLNNEISEIEKVLNVDQTLWMHALNYTLINFDSYIGYAQNYYLYQDDAGRMNPILWDLNMSIGSFRLTDASTFYDGFTPEQAKRIDPLSHFKEYSVFLRPLMRNLFENSRYRKMYLAHIRTIVEENFFSQDYLMRAQLLHNLIDSSVQNDTNKFYSYDNFQDNLYQTVSDLVEYPGIVDLIEGRASYLSSYPGFQGEPEIAVVEIFSEESTANDTILIKAHVTDATEVFIAYRNSEDLLFSKERMNDAGLDGDAIVGDSIFSFQFFFEGQSLDYYIYAENDSAGVFSPERAAYEYHNFSKQINSTGIVINELMAYNSNVIEDQYGEYDDWIELYNTSENTLFLGGLFLSDESSNLSKWPLPNDQLTKDSYLIIWADNEEHQGPNHASFKLSSEGETIFLSDADHVIIDSISFPIQFENISYARSPNGTGTFSFFSPTFNLSNNQATPIPSENNFYVSMQPNPCYDELEIKIESQTNSLIKITDIFGTILFQKSVPAGITATDLSLSKWISGFYLVTIKSSEFITTQKIVKL